MLADAPGGTCIRASDEAEPKWGPIGRLSARGLPCASCGEGPKDFPPARGASLAFSRPQETHSGLFGNWPESPKTSKSAPTAPVVDLLPDAGRRSAVWLRRMALG